MDKSDRLIHVCIHHSNKLSRQVYHMTIVKVAHPELILGSVMVPVVTKSHGQNVPTPTVNYLQYSLDVINNSKSPDPVAFYSCYIRVSHFINSNYKTFHRIILNST